jgi:hypothetical protein
MEDTEIREVGVEKVAEDAHEHAGHHHAPWTRWLALTTACFAVVAAVASMLSGRHANEALLAQTRATDQWAYYQAKGNKQVTRSAELEVLTAVHASAETTAHLKAEIEKYTAEQEEIRNKATELEAESHASLHRHEWFAAIVTLLQVAIGLSAIAALVENRNVWLVSSAAGLIAVLVFLWRVVAG